MNVEVFGCRLRHATRRRFPLVLAMLLTVTLILPTALVRPALADNHEDAAATETAVATETEAATASPLPEASPIAALQITPAVDLDNGVLDPGSPYSRINVTKHECPASFRHNKAQLDYYCSGPGRNFEFQMFGPNFQQTSINGIIQDGLVAGDYRIRELIPNGYGEPVVFCRSNQGAYQEVVTYDGYYEFTLSAQTVFECQWYNIKRPAQGPSPKVLINKHVCPPFAEFDAYGGTIYDLAQYCQEPAVPAVFNVYQNNAKVGGGVAEGAPNLLSLNNLPNGTVTIIEDLPDGYGEPRVFCSVRDELGNTLIPTAEMPTNEDQFDLNLVFGDVVFCDVFNIPEELGVSITVVKYFCPDTIGYHSEEYDWYAEECTETAEGISFKLDGASTGNPGEQQTDANGTYTWSEMEADLYYLSEIMDEENEGYGKPVVYCAYYLPAALETDRQYEPFEVEYRADDDLYRIDFEIEDGQYIVCVWFNVKEHHASPSPGHHVSPSPGHHASPSPTHQSSPTASPTSAPTSQPTSAPTSAPSPPAGASPSPGPATLIIQVNACENGYDYWAIGADPATECDEDITAVTFDLAPANGAPSPGPRSADATALSAEARFADVEVGTYRLTHADYTSGQVAFILNCESNLRDFSNVPVWPFALVTADGSVQLSVIANETLTCSWYNVPAAGAQGLTIRVYDCPGSETSLTVCAPATTVVRFTLISVTDGTLPIVFETDTNGVAVVGSLSGTYTLSQVGQQSCAIESTNLDADGNLTFIADEANEVIVYNCA